MDLTLRSDNGPSEIPTLSAVTVDFMRHLAFYEGNGKPVPEIQGIADALESGVLAGKIIVTTDIREGISPKDFENVAEGLYNRSVNLQQRYEKQKKR